MPLKFRSSHLQHCKVFKNIYFEKHLWAATSENQHLGDKFRSSCPKKVFLEILQNSQESTCARASFLTKLQV